MSPRIKTELLALGIGRPEQFEVIPLGLALRRFLRPRPGSPTIRRELGLAGETPVLGIVGRLVPIKDHAMLVRASTAGSFSRSISRGIAIAETAAITKPARGE